MVDVVMVEKGFRILIPLGLRESLSLTEGETLQAEVSPGSYLILRKRIDSRSVLAEEAFGMWADREDIKSGVEHVRRLRAEWKGRMEIIDV
ncbi:MAG: hypothetical protein WBW48_10255 [Anaerolineae bacterium]